MVDIGSIFPIYTMAAKEKVVCDDLLNVFFFSLGRDGIAMVARKCHPKSKVVLIPAYTCDTVIRPFLENNYEVKYYPVLPNLQFDVKKTSEIMQGLQPGVIVVHPYFGMRMTNDFLEEICRMKKRGWIILADITQGIFSTQFDEIADYCVGSLHKWYPIPDGGFLRSKEVIEGEQLEEYDRMVELKKDSMYLRGLYYRSGDIQIKEISRRLDKMARKITAESRVTPHRMSDYSFAVYLSSRNDDQQQIRLNNYQYLLDHLQRTQWSMPICTSMDQIESAPLYFPILTERREELQKHLAVHQIYAPVLWPVKREEVLIDETVQRLYREILAIPIDQRYGIEEMKRIVESFESFGKS